MSNEFIRRAQIAELIFLHAGVFLIALIIGTAIFS